MYQLFNVFQLQKSMAPPLARSIANMMTIFIVPAGLSSSFSEGLPFRAFRDGGSFWFHNRLTF